MHKKSKYKQKNKIKIKCKIKLNYPNLTKQCLSKFKCVTIITKNQNTLPPGLRTRHVMKLSQSNFSP